jgi:IS5 family transposase
MVHFRKRLDQEIMKKINDLICQSEKPEEPKDKDPEDKGPKGEAPKDKEPGNPSASDSFEVWKPDENKR